MNASERQSLLSAFFRLEAVRMCLEYQGRFNYPKRETNLSLQIERAAYDEFIRLWGQGSFKHLRLGQAFYNHFNLHKLNDQDSLRKFYEADGEKASRLILRLFHFH